MLRRVGLPLLFIAPAAYADDDRDYTLVDDTIEYVTAADERTIAVATALTSQAMGTPSSMPTGAGAATIHVDAGVVEIAGSREGYRFALGGEGELRAGLGYIPEQSGSWVVRAALEDTPLFDGGPHGGFAPASFEMRRDYDALPSLRDSRELLRAPFDRSRYEAHFAFSRSREDRSEWSGTTLPLRLASERTRQYNGDVAVQSQVIDFELGVFRLCYGPDSDLFCVRIIEGGVVDAIGSSLKVAHWHPLGVDGIPLGRDSHIRIDARAGVLIGHHEIPGAQPVGDPDSPTATCKTLRTCVDMTTFGYELTVRSLRAPHRLTIARRAYRESGGVLAIEDRAALAMSWQLDRTKLDAAAYVAHTRWWAIIDDAFARQDRGVTGGVDLAVSRELGRRWRIDGALSAGRSWYGALDGDAPRAGFAAQGTLSIAHELRSHWASLQRLRPAPPEL